MGVLAQQEYFQMAQGRGLFPARRLSMLGSVLMYIAAADGRRGVIDAALPLVGIYTTMYLLTRPTPEPTLDDVTSTFMGVYYLGFLPSFWVRLRGLAVEGAPSFAFQWWPAGLGPGLFTHGAVITWWTFLSIVCSDIGAYFVGKGFGSTKLISSVSPNKTLEGALGGMAAAVLSSLLGAYLMRWPSWWLSGALHGVIASVSALVGDLTISMFKRSSGVKDTGKLLPGHGGLLDRVDSFLLAAAPIYFYVKYALPLFPR
ncbi:phosphatidate cytidylyltransferase [Pavlovales sp. CCMP2436]|nr:phosphatidate cytidylyltransferase [Pavlovales sp. CCMP2436]